MELLIIDILIWMFAGILLGTITGLIPGIHPNTVFALIVSGSAGLLFFVPNEYILVFIISTAVSNTFTDFLPSVLFGAPDPSNVLSVLPGHKMLMMGRGHEAVVLTVIGGLGVAMIIILTLPLLIYIIPSLYFLIRPLIHVILSLVVLWVILTERSWKLRGFAFIVFLFSGLLGFVTLSMYPSDTLLFPSLTGLFALSTMIVSYSAKSKIPKQRPSREISGDHRKGILSGWIAGWFAGMLPGIGSSQSGVIVSQVFRTRTREFLTALGGINTSNILFTFVMFYVLGKTRSGAVWAISQFSYSISMWSMVMLVFVALTVCFISSLVTILLARNISERIGNIDYGKLTLFVFILLFLLVILLSGLLGIIAALTGTMIGLVAIKTGIKRSHMMGYLILPTILYFSGYSSFFMFISGF